MSSLEITVWVILSLLGFTGAALCSGAETGAYTLNRVRLHILTQRGIKKAKLLTKFVSNPTIMITTLLIGTNIMSYLATASLAVILDNQHITTLQAIVINTAIVTPILFLFSEVLPKDLFAVHADSFMYPLARLLNILQNILTYTGLVPIVNMATTLIMQALGNSGNIKPAAPRRQIAALVKEGVGYGVLSDEQSALTQRVLDLSKRTIGDEMIRWNKVITVKVNSNINTLWSLADRTSHSRFPVVEQNNPNKVVGVIDITKALINQQDNILPISSLMSKPTFMPGNTPVREALSNMQKNRLQLLIVTGPKGKPLGIVTIKDLVEAITGELTAW